VTIGSLFECRGEIEKAVDLWRKACPLYEKSSQAKEMAKLDQKLQDIANLECNVKLLQQLVALNVPVEAYSRRA
jgi:hypothetical protein